MLGFMNYITYVQCVYMIVKSTQLKIHLLLQNIKKYFAEQFCINYILKPNS